MKQRTEILLKATSNPFTVVETIQQKAGILKAFVANANTIVIYYDNRKTTVQKLLKATGGVSTDINLDSQINRATLTPSKT